MNYRTLREQRDIFFGKLCVLLLFIFFPSSFLSSTIFNISCPGSFFVGHRHNFFCMSLCVFYVFIWSTSTSLDVEVDQMYLNIQGICVSFSLKFPASPNNFSHSEQVWVFSPLRVNMCVFRFLAQPNDFWHWTQCVSFLCCGLPCASSVALLDQMTFCSVNKSASFLHCG